MHSFFGKRLRRIALRNFVQQTTLSVFLIMAVLSACALAEPESVVSLDAEIAAIIPAGVPRSEATRVLVARGFLCRDGTSLEPHEKVVFECTRSRTSLWLPYICMHRVWFEATTADGRVVGRKIFKPVCRWWCFRPEGF